MKVDEIVVLIVDDVNAVRVQVKELLRSIGFTKFLTADSGVEAKVFLELEKVDFIVSDWHMSPVDGLELLQWTRTVPRLAQMPFLMLTGESTKEKVLEAIQAGVDDYLVKPLTAVQVRSRVMGILQKKKVLTT